jgi:hypothetical protein
MQNRDNNFGESKAGGSTLLAQLGFADRDRANPLHRQALAFAVGRAAFFAHELSNGTTLGCCAKHAPYMHGEVKIERSRSDFLVGFADGVLRWTQRGTDYVPAEHRSSTWSEEELALPMYRLAIVEVKITPCGADDIVRQVEAYRGGRPCMPGLPFASCGAQHSPYQSAHSDGTPAFHLHNAPAILLVNFPLLKSDLSLLASHDVHPFRLGASFKRFITECDGEGEMPEL